MGISLLKFHFTSFSNKSFNRSTDYLLRAVNLAVVVRTLIQPCRWEKDQMSGLYSAERLMTQRIRCWAGVRWWTYSVMAHEDTSINLTHWNSHVMLVCLYSEKRKRFELNRIQLQWLYLPFANTASLCAQSIPMTVWEFSL